jgi:hypothetical protein
MLQIIHKIIAWIIALAVLLSTMSFTVAKHVCMGEVTDVAYYQEAEGCGMEEISCDDETASGDQVEKQACCDTVHELISGEPAEQQAMEVVQLQDFDADVQLFYVFPNFTEEAQEKVLTFYTGPPKTDYDVHILFQRFLI